ncbi:MAG: hypothetical protein Q8941_09245 [Bacteroidota bacterium]|nr:hypothetical protein [Bacteroidota bacterium]
MKGTFWQFMELKLASKKIVIIGALIIWAIKFIVRPLHLFGEPLKFFLGIAPNLFGSFLIPFGAYWFFSGKNFLLARLFRLQSAYDLGLVCIMGFGMLVVNEYLQLIPFFGRTFDYYDIVFSLVGLAVAYFVFGKIQHHYEPRAN